MNEKYPLGEPVNRPIKPVPISIPGRPNWWQNHPGEEPYYIEPPKPPAGVPPAK